MEKRKSLHKIWRGMMVAFAVSLLTCACGREEFKEQESKEQESKELVSKEQEAKEQEEGDCLYAAEEILLGEGMRENYRVCGDDLYYLDFARGYEVCRVPINAEAAAQRNRIKKTLVAQSGIDREILCYTVDGDQSVYYYQGVMKETDSFYREMIKGELGNAGLLQGI